MKAYHVTSSQSDRLKLLPAGVLSYSHVTNFSVHLVLMQIKFKAHHSGTDIAS